LVVCGPLDVVVVEAIELEPELCVGALGTPGVVTLPESVTVGGSGPDIVGFGVTMVPGCVYVGVPGGPIGTVGRVNVGPG